MPQPTQKRMPTWLKVDLLIVAARLVIVLVGVYVAETGIFGLQL